MNAFDSNFEFNVARMELSSQGNESVRILASYCSSLVQEFLSPYRVSQIVSCLLFHVHTSSDDQHERGQTVVHLAQSHLPIL